MRCQNTSKRLDPKECRHQECLESYKMDLLAQFAAAGFRDFDYYEGWLGEISLVNLMLAKAPDSPRIRFGPKRLK